MNEIEKHKKEEIARKKALEGKFTMKLDSFDDVPKSPVMETEKGTINLDELAREDRHQQPRFLEEVRRKEDGAVKAYVLKRNPNYKKES